METTESMLMKMTNRRPLAASVAGVAPVPGISVLPRSRPRAPTALAGAAGTTEPGGLRTLPAMLQADQRWIRSWSMRPWEQPWLASCWLSWTKRLKDKGDEG